MDPTVETQTGFFGTYFDRDAVLRIARTANVIAWVLLAFYGYITLVSIGQYLSLVASGMITFENMTLFDRLSIQQALLILLDLEDNSRRAARKV